MCIKCPCLNVETLMDSPQQRPIDELVLEIIDKHAKGIRDKELRALLPGINPALLVSAINEMVKKVCSIIYYNSIDNLYRIV